MCFFIAIILIAELIIAIALVNIILKTSKQVCVINNQLIEITPLIKECFTVTRNSLSKLNTIVEKILSGIKKKKSQFTIKLILTSLMYACLVLFKKKYKNAAIIFQTLVIVKDYFDELKD